MVAYAVGLALGQPIHGMRPAAPCRVMLYNVEDDQDEQKRRLSAVLTSMGRAPADIAGRVARVMPTGAGALLEHNPDPDHGPTLRHTAAMVALIAAIERERPDVLVLDPFAELHDQDENANVALREVVAVFRRLAVDHNLALVLVHHTRKGPADPGNMDAARGASSVVSAARVVLTVSTMDEAAAERLGIAPDKRRHYFRVDGAKSNYAELTDAEWFERVSYSVGAGDDTVAVPVPWEPPSDAVSLDTRLAIERAVEQGSGAEPWSVKLSGDARSVRRLFEQHGIRNTKKQREELDGLLARGFKEAAYRRPNRGVGSGLRASSGKPHEVKWIAEQSS
ncbi:MAG: AAA family ATPase [Janthinobacterium lividum]